MTAFITHRDCRLHNMGDHHPECPERLAAIHDRLISAQLLDYLDQQTAHEVTDLQLSRVHTPAYLELLEATLPIAGTARLDPDTAMSAGTLQAARKAAGAVVQAVDLVIKGKNQNAFCCVRPPGHHATSDKAMGFCFINNIAVGMSHALAEHKLKKIALIDFDVHHGNGSEEIFKDDERVMMLSIFQHPFFPYSGDRLIGTNPNIHNIPMKAGSGSKEFRLVVEQEWVPKLHEFQPEMIFISAGFDAHREDDMGSLGLVEADYEWVTLQLLAIAKQYSQGRIVSSLEGGYDLSSLARSVAVHIKALSGM